MHFSWDLIRTFDAVALTGSLLAAARSLGLSQPTVGRHIDLLEDALNVSLFMRSREGMALTEAGEDLVATSRDMVRTAEVFKRRASGLDRDVSGVLRISVNDILGVYVLPRLLRDFMELYPAIEVELDIANTAVNLSRRDADIALRMFRPIQNDLIARKVSEIPLGFYANRTYLARHGRPEGFSDLRQHRLIGFDREMFHINAAEALGEIVTASDFAFRCDSIPAQIEAVRAGLGIGILHKGLAAHIEGLERLLPQAPLPSLELWIASHSNVRHNLRIRLLVDFLATRLRTPYAIDGNSKI
ncbi:MAG: LysR family transcriptional regulator [Paracoccaceae bacterium]|nr:LysR family transcriptional regulator [Paracoccaceae bacterium]